MKSIANTTLNFGLLSAPVKIFSAFDNTDISFKLCGPEGEDVEQIYRIKGSETVLGGRQACERKFEDFMIDRDVLTQIEDASTTEDGKSLKHINVEAFVPLKTVPFHRVKGCYYIGADPKGGTPFALATVVKAMEKKRLAAVAKVVLKGRQHAFVLYVEGGLLRAVSLAFADSETEITEEANGHRSIKVDRRQLDLATQLIESYLDPEATCLDEMHDTLIARKQELIDQARKGEPIAVEAVGAPTKAPDLMEAMEKMIEERSRKKVAA